MVMRKTQRIYLWRTIRKNLVSFLAVAMMAATAISIYLGDQAAAQAILNAADRYFVEHRLQNLEVSSPYYITPEDIQAISQWEGVDAVEGGYSAIVLTDIGNGTGKTLVQAHALLNTMNIPVVLEGVLPQAADEAAVEQIMAEKEGIHIGDRIRVEHEGELMSSEYTVTAIINQPAYCYARPQDARGQSDIGIGSVYYYIALPKAAFDSSHFDGGYSTAYIRNNDLDQYHYFSDAYKEQEAAFQAHIEALGESRGQLRYEQALRSMPQKLTDAREELYRQERNLASGKQMLSAIEQSIGLSSANAYLADSLAQLHSALEDGERALEAGWEALVQAEEAELPYYGWIVSPRHNIGDVRSIEIAVEGLYGLSYSMAIIFVLVAMTVCYSAVSRMISENSQLMGMQKALGFTSQEIRTHFLSYSILCGLWGALEGWICGFLFVQGMNLYIYQTVFLLGNVPLAFPWKTALPVSAFFIVIFLVSAYAACARQVHRTATELLRGESAMHSRTFRFEGLKFYRKLRLYTKTMIKNVLADKSRMITTVMGVAGCATLLVISFTLLLAMKDSERVPFEHYLLYENRLVTDSRKTDGAAFEDLLEEKHVPYARITDKLKLCRGAGGEWSGAHVLALGADQPLEDFLVLEDPETRQILEIPDQGALISIRYAETLGLEKGDEFEVLGSDGTVRKLTVSGVIEHYLGFNLFVTSKDYYESVFAEPADDCVFLLKGNIDGLYDDASTLEGFISLRDNSEYTGLGDVMNIIVLICFVFAALMAVLVMLNQNVMYIEQKAKELSVMRINGFTMKETKAFVSRDTFILTALGILAGWVLGVILGHWVILILEVGVTHYVRSPSWKACLIAAAICGIFAFAMNKIAVRRIAKLNLTNVNAN